MVPVAALKHPVRARYSFEFGVTPMLLHHEMSNAVDILIRKHGVVHREARPGERELIRIIGLRGAVNVKLTQKMR